MKYLELRSLGIVAALVVLGYVDLQEGDPPSDQAARTGQSAQTEKSSLPPQKTASVPAGTKIDIRVEENIRIDKNATGGLFTATLRGPLIFANNLLAPSRCRIIGQLTGMSTAGRASEVTVALRKLEVDGKEYEIDTLPVKLTVSSRKGPDQPGGTASAETIGALTGIESSPPHVVIGIGSRVMFTLASPLELPVIRKLGR